MAVKYLLQCTGPQVDSRLEVPKPVAQGGTGQTSRYTSAAVTNDTSVVSGHAITVRHYPQLGLCFCRGYVKLSGTAMEANIWFPIATATGNAVPATDYATALSVNVYGGGDVQITGAGLIRCRIAAAYSPSSSSRDIYFSGWWQTA